MKLAVLMFLLCATRIVYALDAWEFSLNGMNDKSKLVSFTPLGSDDDAAIVWGKNDQIVKMTIEKFVDANGRTVLQRCIWNKPDSTLACKGNGIKQIPVQYKGVPLKSNKGTDTITASTAARAIQAALEKQKTCTTADAYFVCKENCPASLPKTMLLVYCGD